MTGVAQSNKGPQMTIINWIFDYRNTVFIAAFDHNDSCNDTSFEHVDDQAAAAKSPIIIIIPLNT